MKVSKSFLSISLLGVFFFNGTNKEPESNMAKTGLSSNLFTQDMDLPEGTYYIKPFLNPSKYLDVSWSCRNEDHCKVQLWELGNSTSNNKWVVKNAGIPFIGGYTLTSKVNNKVLSVMSNVNHSDLLVTERNGLLGSDYRTMQEWKIKRIESMATGQGIYKIYNVANGKYMDVVNSCINTNGCKIQIYSHRSGELTQEWLFIKTN